MFSEFKGIRPLMEGLVDADYLNCVPTGTNVVERTNWDVDTQTIASAEFFGKRGMDNSSSIHIDGERIKNLWTNRHTNYLGSKEVGEYLLSFFIADPDYVDPLAWQDPTSEKITLQHLFIIRSNLVNGHVGNSVMWSTSIFCDAGNLPTLDINSLSVCVSGTSPRICFISFKNITTYWINIDKTTPYDSVSASATYMCHEIGAIADPVYMLHVLETYQSGTIDTGDTSMLYHGDYFQACYELANDLTYEHNGCDWYDNALVTVSSNAVWITRTDPYKYLQASLAGLESGATESYTWNQYGVNDFWTKWYSSTLSYDKIKDVKACYGQLYFINEHSIEMWTRSGTESDPLNNVSNYVNNVTIKKCSVIKGRLWAIVETDSRLDVALIGADGGQTTVSNSAVAKLLKDYVDEYTHFTSVLQNNESHFAIVRFTDTTAEFLCYNMGGQAWYRLSYPLKYAPLVQFDKFTVNASGLCLAQNDVCIGDPNYKTKYERHIVDVFIPLTKRKSLSAVEVYGEFGYGSAVENTDKLMLQNSWTNGRTWSNEYWRNPPRLGQFQPKIVFHGLGSGETILLKFKWFNIKPYVITGINPIAN